MVEALVPVRGEDLGGDGKLAGERTSDLVFEIGRNTQIRIVAAAVVSVFSRPQRITIAVRALGLVQPASVVEIRTGLRADETRFCGLEKRQTALRLGTTIVRTTRQRQSS